MKIDKKLCLILPIYDDKDEAVAYVHATPISAEVFDRYFLVIAKTYAQIYQEGLGYLGGPRVADKMLKKVAEDLKCWDTPDGVQRGLVAEIHRLTNVMHIRESGGWELLPFGEARKKGVISADDASEVEAALIFFTVGSLMHRKTQAGALLSGPVQLWGARIESLSCTEFLNSLPTSTVTATIGAKTAA